MWDILGKAVNRPIYKLLGGTKDRVMAYASSQHLANIEDYVADALAAKEQGYRGYKIHPGGGQHKERPAIPAYIGHIEEIQTIRKAVGDDFVLAHDPVQRYNLFEALKVGRVLDELNYAVVRGPHPHHRYRRPGGAEPRARSAAARRRVPVLHLRFRRIHPPRRARSWRG